MKTRISNLIAIFGCVITAFLIFSSFSLNRSTQEPSDKTQLTVNAKGETEQI